MLGRFEVLAEMAIKAGAKGEESRQAILSGLYQASWRALLIGLAGLLSTDQESITLCYLLDLAGNHPHDFARWTPEQVQAEVRSSRQSLAALDDFEERLRALRDRRLAHLDRKHINEPETFSDLTIRLLEAQEVLKFIERTVRDFHLAFYDEDVLFDDHKRRSRVGLDQLIA